MTIHFLDMFDSMTDRQSRHKFRNILHKMLGGVKYFFSMEKPSSLSKEILFTKLVVIGMFNTI